MYVLNKTDIFIFYVTCIKHFLASDLMNICLGNVVVVRRVVPDKKRKLFLYIFI
jgi:hypothetical protein